MSRVDRAVGCLFGAAFGDSLGLETEFRTLQQIEERWPPHGPTDLSDPAFVTDDTQMMLAVGEALVLGKLDRALTPTAFEPLLRAELVKWLHSPDNNRAPGRTCMTACERLDQGAPWIEATVPASKGCGANMRVAPVGLLASELRAKVAQFQAALTHGHPTALAASDLTAFTICSLADGVTPDTLLEVLRSYVASERTHYHEDWLGTLWRTAGASDPAAFIAVGWDECAIALDRVSAGMRHFSHAEDPCDATGEGWIAEEAFATGLLCFLTNRDDPAAAIRRAAATRGDSDSIACLAGAFAGASLGAGAWPQGWFERIEYRHRLQAVAAGLAG